MTTFARNRIMCMCKFRQSENCQGSCRRMY